LQRRVKHWRRCKGTPHAILVRLVAVGRKENPALAEQDGVPT